MPRHQGKQYTNIRTAADKGRDTHRKPRETLEFRNLGEDMRVVERLPAGGRDAKIIAPVVADEGQLDMSLS